MLLNFLACVWYYVATLEGVANSWLSKVGECVPFPATILLCFPRPKAVQLTSDICKVVTVRISMFTADKTSDAWAMGGHVQARLISQMPQEQGSGWLPCTL